MINTVLIISFNLYRNLIRQVLLYWFQGQRIRGTEKLSTENIIELLVEGTEFDIGCLTRANAVKSCLYFQLGKQKVHCCKQLHILWNSKTLRSLILHFLKHYVTIHGNNFFVKLLEPPWICLSRSCFSILIRVKEQKKHIDSNF